jgi:hypothetical protein
VAAEAEIMIIDDIRAKYPHLGIGLYAMEPGGVVTLETYLPDGQVFSFTAATVAGCIEKAFPEVATPASEPDPPAPTVFD